jgi:YidC/Oxa1 family membrane protein insertase
MDRRTVLALVLVAAVILLTPRLFPPPQRIPVPTPDTVRVADTVAPTAQTPTATTPTPQPAAVSAPASSQADSIALGAPAETLSVADSTSTIRFTTMGGAMLSAEMHQYAALGGRTGSVRLMSPGTPLLRFNGIVVGGDTVQFDAVPFTVVERATVAGAERIVLQGTVGADTLTLSYLANPDSFLVRLDGQVRGPLASGGYILMQYAPTLESFEADTVDDQRNLGFVYEVATRGARGTAFSSLDPGEREVAQGPLTWVALKNKYFIVGALARDSASPIAEFMMTGGPRVSRVETHAQGTAVIQPRMGAFALDIYAGPQQANRLQSLGRDFVNSNPYGGFMQPVVQPFAGVVLQVLLWMRHTFNLGYGWVLVIFGVAVRLILWPLNQKAMKTSMKMQLIQPELQAVQAKYKNEPQKLQTEMMRVYKEHDMSPFSMFSGCLPLLLPMPILFALFFVFQSTIEFRGVSFMWLSDISQKDPYYILPLLMGVSMFFLSWISTRNTPPNPQTKMMGYVMPVMMTFLLANFAAGLNLYYAVQNVAALPQQWLIAKDRAKMARNQPTKK